MAFAFYLVILLGEEGVSARRLLKGGACSLEWEAAVEIREAGEELCGIESRLWCPLSP